MTLIAQSKATTPATSAKPPDYPATYRQNTLFPPCLGEGSEGPATQALQILLLREGWRGTTGRLSQSFIPDGNYGPVTTAGVRWLQRDILGLEGKAVTGEFDQATRAAYAQQFGVEVNQIPSCSGGASGTIWFQGGMEQPATWPKTSTQRRLAGADDDEADPEPDDLLFGEAADEDTDDTNEYLERRHGRPSLDEGFGFGR